MNSSASGISDAQGHEPGPVEVNGNLSVDFSLSLIKYLTYCGVSVKNCTYLMICTDHGTVAFYYAERNVLSISEEDLRRTKINP